MKKRSSKRYKKLIDTFKDKKISTLEESIKKAKQSSTAKFDESIDVSLKLNLKQKKEDITLRTVVNLPHGNGKKIKVAVLCEENKIKESKSSGAEIVGAESLVEEILSGKINFDRLVATPAMMSKMGKLGKILGPKGLMPNPKLGTVTNDIKKAVKSLKEGQIEIKNDSDGNLSASIGKKSFDDKKIIDNFNALIQAIQKEKPSGIKGDFIISSYLTSTMGVSHKLKVKA